MHAARLYLANTWFSPHGGGWWSTGVGAIMLGLNAARYFNGLRMSGFTAFLGIVSVIGGILDLVAIAA